MYYMKIYCIIKNKMIKSKVAYMSDDYLEKYSNTYKLRWKLTHDKKILDKKYRKEFYIKSNNIDEWVKFKVDDILIWDEISYPLLESSMNRIFYTSEKEFLKENIYSKTFIEWRHLMNAFRDFISTSFKNLDLVVHKYDNDSKVLSYYGWSNDLDLDRIHIEEFVENRTYNNEYKNELSALFDKKEWEISFLKVENESSGWRLSFKINLPWWDSIILSIRLKESLYDVDPLMVNLELKRLESILSKTWIIQYLKEELNLIEAKYKDYLTWLYNREYLDTITKFKKFSLLNIDINEFKNINDTYWHLNWDKVLKKLAWILYRTVKDNDRVCRTGWDEFLVLVSTNSQKELDLVVERILKRVNKELIFDFDWEKECSSDCKTCSKKYSWNCKKVWISIWWVLMDPKKSVIDMISESDKLMFDQKTDHWKMYRILSQLSSIEDYDILSDIFSEVFENMLDKWIEWKVLDSRFRLVFKEMLQLTKDEKSLKKVKKLIDDEINKRKS